MRVILIHHGDQGLGGGQIAMNRLAVGLRRAGVDARLLCKVTTRNDSIAMPSMPTWEAGFAKVARRLGFNDLHGVSSFKIRKMEAFLEADVLDFHCIHGGFFNYLALPRLTEDKSAVFTLHDVWPFTGGCGISRDCDRWTTGCGKCPYPAMRAGADRLWRDSTHLEWRLKNWTYAHSKFAVVAPSHWMVAKARQSMLNRFPIHHIPYGIDTDIYQPHDTELCRSLLGIPPHKHVLLSAATDLNAYLKGADLLQKALQTLPATLKADIFLLLLGRGGEIFAQAVGLPARSFGYVSSDYLKAI